MFRVSLIVCVSLIFGITAKPLWNKLPDETFYGSVMSIDDEATMSWNVEVEPPEDMDETHYKIDPNMMIWKSMKGMEHDKQAEEDLDELYHPSMADLLKVQIQNLDVLSAVDIQVEPAQENTNEHEEPEEDRDDIDHPVFSEVASEEPEQDRYLALLKADQLGAEVRIPYSKLKDDLYHHENQRSPPQMGQPRREVRLHFEPEEDMDDLYHKDVQQPVPYQDTAEAAAPVDLPSQRKHSEPEEDLDDLYHQ